MKKVLFLALVAFIPNLFACYVENKLEYCEGNFVINKQGLKATIKEIFDNGTAHIKYPSYDMEAILPLSDLGVIRGETEDGFKILDAVLTPFGEKAQIAAIFQDGQVALYTYDFWKHQVHPSNVVPRTEGCTEDGFCVGDSVKNRYGIEATVVGVMNHSPSVYISYEGQERIFKWSTKDLIK